MAQLNLTDLQAVSRAQGHGVAWGAMSNSRTGLAALRSRWAPGTLGRSVPLPLSLFAVLRQRLPAAGERPVGVAQPLLS